ncbi:ankyrin repeat domain-containing protein [Ottowia thiooxydans]|uniref:Ankyrin repeat protein n=1 Tax=Ottowia thiooxydans TaxID=219182 RepID=A0ABV2QFV5_9BURK
MRQSPRDASSWNPSSDCVTNKVIVRVAVRVSREIACAFLLATRPTQLNDFKKFMNFGSTTPNSSQLPPITQGFGASYPLAAPTRHQAEGCGERDVQMGDGAARDALLEARGVDPGKQIPTMPERLRAAINHADDAALKQLFEADCLAFQQWMNHPQGAFLVKAALSDEISKLSFLLSKGAHPNIPDAGGKTALHVAIARQDPLRERMVDALLRSGADFTLRDNEGRSPLMLATRAESEKRSSDPFVRLLKRYEPRKINELDPRSGTTVLLDVIDAGASVSRVAAVVNKGADVNLQDSGAQWTPLICAVERCRVDLVLLLLNQGADFKIRDAQGRSPLMIAYERLLDAQHEKVLELLAARTGSHAEQRFTTESALQVQRVSNPYKEIATLLLGKAGNLNQPDEQGRTGLMDLQNLQSNRVPPFQRLVVPIPQPRSVEASQAHRHMCTAVDNNDMALLTGLQAQFSAEAFTALMNDPSGGFLMKACAYGRATMVNFMLAQGANPNAMDSLGRTPLFFAVANRKAEVVEILLAIGADVQVGGLLTLENALARAVAEQRKERSEIVQETLWWSKFNACSIGGWEAILNAVSNRISGTLTLLLSHIKEIDTQHVRGRTALIDVIAARGDRATVENLLSRRPNVMLRDDDGRSAFDHAQGQPALLEALTDYVGSMSKQEYVRLCRESETAFNERMKLLVGGAAEMSDFNA